MGCGSNIGNREYRFRDIFSELIAKMPAISQTQLLTRTSTRIAALISSYNHPRNAGRQSDLNGSVDFREYMNARSLDTMARAPG